MFVKRFICLILFLILCALSVSSYAEWQKCPIGDSSATISFPESCYVFYDGMPDNGLSQKVLGGSTSEVIDYIESQGADCFAVFDNFETEVTVSYSSMTVPINFSDVSLLELKNAAKGLASQFSDHGAVNTSYTTRSINDANFIEIEYEMHLATETDYRLVYYTTTKDGSNMFMIVFTTVNKSFSDSDRSLFQNICGTLTL